MRGSVRLFHPATAGIACTILLTLLMTGTTGAEAPVTMLEPLGEVTEYPFTIEVRIRDGEMPFTDGPDRFVTAVAVSDGINVAQFSLNDSGAEGDREAGDGIWTKQVYARLEPGDYTWAVKAKSPDSLNVWLPETGTFTIVSPPEPSPLPRYGLWLLLLLVAAGGGWTLARTVAVREQPSRGPAVPPPNEEAWGELFRGMAAVDEALDRLAGGVAETQAASRGLAGALEEAFIERRMMRDRYGELLNDVRYLVELYGQQKRTEGNMEAILMRLANVISSHEGGVAGYGTDENRN